MTVQLREITHIDTQLAFQERMAPLQAGDGIRWLGGVMRLLVWRKTRWPLAFVSHHGWNKHELLDVFEGRINDHRAFERVATALRTPMPKVFETYDKLVATYSMVPKESYRELAALCEPTGKDAEIYTKLLLSRRLESHLLGTPPHEHPHPLFFVTMAEACGRSQACEEIAKARTTHHILEGLLRPVLEDVLPDFACELTLDDARLQLHLTQEPPATLLLEAVSGLLHRFRMSMVSCEVSPDSGAILEFEMEPGFFGAPSHDREIERL